MNISRIDSHKKTSVYRKKPRYTLCFLFNNRPKGDFTRSKTGFHPAPRLDFIPYSDPATQTFRPSSSR